MKDAKETPNEIISGAWMEIDLDALRHNYHVVRNIVGSDTRICAVVKADAYGHGVYETAKALVKDGVDYLAVAVLDEAVELRKMGIEKDILILGPMMQGQSPYILRYNLTQTICSPEMAEELSREAFKKRQKVKVHIKVDTGMGRIGMYYEDASLQIAQIMKLPYLEVEGIFTHYADSDNKKKSYVYEQWNNFNQVLEDLKAQGITIPIAHAATSATIIDLPHMKLNMVRPGIMLYGLYPRADQKERVQLKPALTYKTKISFIKTITKKRSISYGRKYFAKEGEVIATLPLGYNDGIKRALTNRGEVLIGGKRCPIVGTVCMDHVMVNVTHVEGVRRFDNAVLIGKQEQEVISAEMLADKLDTINYEVISSLGRRVPRLYLSQGKIKAVRNLLGYHSKNTLPYEGNGDNNLALLQRENILQ